MNYLELKNTYFEKLSVVERKKFIQEIRIIKYLYVNGPRSNAEICKYLKISVPKSFSVLNDLICAGYIEKKGRGVSIGGRKPDLYGLVEKTLYVLAVEMDRYGFKIGVYDTDNNIVGDLQSYLVPLDNNIKTLDLLYQYSNDVIKASGIDPSKLMGIGISMPGLIDAHKGINYTYMNFGKKSMRDILQEKFNRPVFIENDAKAAALAEYLFGLARNKKDVLVILHDWGIGLGVILDGKLYRGTSGFAGEFSHIPMVEDGAICHCGKHGCFETIASGTALARLAQEGIKSGKSTILSSLGANDDKIEAKTVVEAASKGDQYAIHILSEIGFNLGKGISILIQLFNPELIILGGRIADAGQYITTPIQQSLNIYCMRQLSERTTIKVSEMGQDIGIMGAIAIVMDRIFENYFKTGNK
jgi:N-acetylglucosamine repressor